MHPQVDSLVSFLTQNGQGWLTSSIVVRRMSCRSKALDSLDIFVCEGWTRRLAVFLSSFAGIGRHHDQKHGDISNIWPLDAFGTGQTILDVFCMFFFFLFWDPQEQDQIGTPRMHGVDAGLFDVRLVLRNHRWRSKGRWIWSCGNLCSVGPIGDFIESLRDGGHNHIRRLIQRRKWLKIYDTLWYVRRFWSLFQSSWFTSLIAWVLERSNTFASSKRVAFVCEVYSTKSNQGFFWESSLTVASLEYFWKSRTLFCHSLRK